MIIYEALWLLREDAKARGMLDLAIVYDWSTIRRGDELMRITRESNQFLTDMFPPKEP